MNQSEFQLQGGTVGSHGAAFNPFFIDPVNNDFHLGQGSIFKSASNSGGEIGAYGPGPGQPAAGTRVSWGRLKTLYRQ
jgi:hypothetical protein